MSNTVSTINHMTHDKTQRGFRIIRFKDRYDNSCSIQESSLAAEPCLWLGQDTPLRIHVTKSLASDLISLLQYFVDNDELPDSIP